MIVYDLRCENNHNFEGWFNDRASFESQKSQRLLACPICGGTDVVMVPSSISIMTSEKRDAKKDRLRELSPMKALEMLHGFLDKHFEEVGDKFAEKALKIHAGEEDQRNIKGTTTKEEEEVLREAGVQFVKIPVPKFDS